MSDKTTHQHWVDCVGPGIEPHSERCKVTVNGWHKVDRLGDSAPYNGVKNWRCPDCMEQHRNLVRLKNQKKPNT